MTVHAETIQIQRKSEHLCEFHQWFQTSHVRIVHRLYVYYHVLTVLGTLEPLRSDVYVSLPSRWGCHVTSCFILNVTLLSFQPPHASPSWFPIDSTCFPSPWCIYVVCVSLHPVPGWFPLVVHICAANVCLPGRDYFESCVAPPELFGFIVYRLLGHFLHQESFLV